ncbi:MAG: hypothetical protein A3K10_16840 [Bacteroidetes bacterium RIFCSPLOWO2_12_FULL_31_6]|nr:MAG: hypothetical protein A3K10_16840 [Bacteroidetes bacterium RIFCSPLOWO2_12_FULL_31_6]
MAKQLTVRWTEQALDSFEDMALQLIENWNYKIAQDFDNDVQELIERLENNAKLCPPSKVKKLRKCVFHKNASLIYRVKSSTIELITFIDNRSNHHF